MNRLLTGFTFIVAVSTTGCHSNAPSDAALPSSVWTVYGGEPYLVEVESEGGISHSYEATLKSENKVVKGFVEATCGTHKLRIDDDRLTFDGVDRGLLKWGDRIKITSAGQLFINGARVNIGGPVR